MDTMNGCSSRLSQSEMEGLKIFYIIVFNIFFTLHRPVRVSLAGKGMASTLKIVTTEIP
jgi:hypothetical protein